MSADSSHYYKRDGSPCYEIATKTSGVRGINLRWDRSLGLVPSVTTVLQIIAKPNLETWKVNQGIMAALTLPRLPYETDEAFLYRVLADSREQAKKAADEGSRVHNAIEDHHKHKPISADYLPHAQAAWNELHRLFPKVSDWVVEKSFAHPTGFGGRVDVHSPSTGIVIDWKGKDGDFSDNKKLIYDQHWQLGAYRRGLCLPINASAANIFFSRTHPGVVTSHVWEPEQVNEGEFIFCAALDLWKLLKGYDGAFQP